ncbi:MAG: Cyclic di-GMP phosphodiesterase response regulator RpfG [Syntrophorhabdus sp. PtaB.Bin006]|nr:MAG: Cyclic di-GMP phosphodiesterase response regulator RpfG [Syntrophorhabdus sp. PtaB.Bin006]
MTHEEKPNTPRKRILIAEDSRSQSAMLSGILTDSGYAVTAAKDGLEGLQRLPEVRPDLVISDVWMPRMNGYEFCESIRQDEGLGNTPIILLTSLSNIRDIIRGLEVGADYFITKPYSEELLLSTVESILSSGQSQSRNDPKVCVETELEGVALSILASPQTVFNFFRTTYENLLHDNHQLGRAKLDLKRLNDRLEEKVKEKTRGLEEEIVERKKAEKALKESFENLRNTLDGTVRALATTIEMRDPYTAGHQRRVSELACAITKEMRGSAEDIKGMEVMGFLHDIGKIVVPAEILSKPGKLNDLEFNMIKAHSQAGHNILKGIEFPWPVSAAVLQHHERLNGSGYPGGLKGPEIAREARIIAVADVVESMASHRPYRPALGIEAALGEVTQHKGTLYDPDAVDACVNLFTVRGFVLT